MEFKVKLCHFFWRGTTYRAGDTIKLSKKEMEDHVIQILIDAGVLEEVKESE